MATHMRSSVNFFTAHKSRFKRILKFGESCVVQWFVAAFLPVFNLFGPGKTALSDRMERYNLPAFILLVLSAWISCCVAFYLPGLAPVSYCEPGKKTNPACLVSV